MIQRNHMMSAHRLSDFRHSQLLGSLSFLLHATVVVKSMNLGAPGFRSIGLTGQHK
jgi:hypothetical protein